MSMKITTFHTGDKTSWCFEVHNDKGKLIGEGNDFSSELQATACAGQFISWYVEVKS